MPATKTSKAVKRLNRAWDKAAKAGDHTTLRTLRGIFEGRGVGVAVSCPLTPRTVERLGEFDTVERSENQVRFVVAGVVFWPSWDEAEEDADALISGIEDQVTLAQMNVFTDLTGPQADMLERSVTKSMKSAAQDIRAAIARAKAAY